ncbi:hypothetical protein KCP73_24175 [Salmonella enterica subsp. enterica]|nr:hypothetical protein KCP73_24175 [Salmonella enterica subsp. enterica]
MLCWDIFIHCKTSMLLITHWLFLITFCLYVCLLAPGGLCAGDPYQQRNCGSGPGEASAESAVSLPPRGGGITQRLWRCGRFRPAGRRLDYRRRRNSDHRNRDRAGLKARALRNTSK